MRTRALILAAAAAAVAFAPIAHADPGDCDYSVGYCGHRFNGPMRQTQDAPGFYGGQNGGDPELCSPFSYQCRGAVPTR